MKLKNLAALIFRIVGTLMMLGGVDAVVSMIDHDFSTGIIGFIMSVGIGICFIVYSKQLAALFCKGLDDDSP